MAKPVKHYGKWRIRWIDENGERQSQVFDQFAEAAHQLRTKEVRVEEIKRGYHLAVKTGKFFNDLCDYWLEHRARKKRSYKDDFSIIKIHLRPAFGTLLLPHITAEKVDQFSGKLNHLSVKTQSNILTLLISLLNEGRRLQWLAIVPVIPKPRIKLFDRDFRYFKSQEEIARFLRAAADEGALAFSMYATAVYTGMRAGELAGLKWGDIDFDRRLITVQNSFDGPTKSGDPRYVPILDVLLPILRSWRLQSSGKLVFPNQVGKMQVPSGHIFREIFHRTLLAAGFPERETSGHIRSYLVFHDLRHTFASQWVMNGGDIFKLQKILGHTSIQMTQRYAHLAPDAFSGDYGLFKALPLKSSAEIVRIHK